MLCGLLTPDEGSGTCLGHDIVKEAWAIKRQVGYMTQRFSLYEDLSIKENLDFVARLYAMDRRRERVAEAPGASWASPTAGPAGRRLSGGWKQRLALTAGVLHQPRRCCSTSPPLASTQRPGASNFWTRSTAWRPTA